METKKTLFIITPHMSTGGCPQVVAKKVELLRDFYRVVVIEYEMIAWTYVVQRNRVINMIGDNFISLSENKEYDLFNAIEDHNPDYIMVEEFPETFMETHIIKRLYSPNRTYKIFETTHSSYSEVGWKKFMPDKFIFVSPFSCETFKDLGIPFDLIEYPIDKKIADKIGSQRSLDLDPDYKHVVNIGLFTRGKNQGYAFEIARLLQDYKIKFHFIGNQASNFEDYWQPIMENKPDNCIVWGERDDTDTFLQASDAHLFTSKLELNPLSIKESLEYSLPTFIFDLPTYKGKYQNEQNIIFLTEDVKKDANQLLLSLGLEPLLEKPINIKLVHILLDPDSPEDLPIDSWESTIRKQRKSRDCWENIKHKFTSYVPRFNVVNRTELPVDTCADPDIINPSKEFKHEPPSLSYGHYGCYKSNKDAIIEEFNEDVDLLVLIGGDVMTDLSPDEFHDKIMEAHAFGFKQNAKMINLNQPVFLSGDHWWSMCTDYGNWVKVPHFMIGDVILIFKNERENIKRILETTKWHSFDIWMAWNYHRDTHSQLYTSKESLVYQLDGYSILDCEEKKW